MDALIIFDDLSKPPSRIARFAHSERRPAAWLTPRRRVVYFAQAAYWDARSRVPSKY